MNVYVGMSVYGCIRSFNGGIVNRVCYIVREILATNIVVDANPQYNLITPDDVGNTQRETATRVLTQ